MMKASINLRIQRTILSEQDWLLLDEKFGTFLTIRDGVKEIPRSLLMIKVKGNWKKSKPKFSKADGFATFSTKSTSYLDDGVQSRMILYRTPMKKRSWVLTRNK